ncbi:galactose-specific lectin nattectin-like [Chaetodon auriga]|uniref:galactose-specific lectin nattectin-like n=1 Tax=Chaetodon auriga TaxID=39042 RepID=UPI004032C834
MNFTMKMLTVSVLLVALMLLTQATADKAKESSAAAAEKEEEEEDSKSGTTADTEDDDSESGSEDDEDESESEENAASGNETDTQGKHAVAKRSLRCRCGWARYGRRCFRYFPVAKTWAMAQRHCQANGGNLVSVHNRYENLYLRRLTRNRVTWIGLSDAQQERYWFWIDGSRVNYAAWARGQPNNYRRREHCAHMNWSAARLWNDIPCTYRYGFVCARRV